MPKLKLSSRVIVTLKNVAGEKVERKVVAKPISKIAEQLGLVSNLDQGDIIIIESEEL